ncbi:MAG: RNA polymerase sigma factor [Solirubrobacterales bacterium]|nr:RNA polymerase sigma factor [Solirubrobacterales bacterium]
MRAGKSIQHELQPFEVALDEHGPRLHAWLVTRVGPDRADDVFQETMLAALAAWESVTVSSLKAWLFSIANNKAIDEERRAVRRPSPEGEIDDWPSAEVTDRLDDPVWDEVRALPGKQRLAVSLRYQGDLSHRQIAEAMGISEAAARRNVFEGLKNLRERIGDE